MRNYFLLLVLLFTLPNYATSINASSFGYNPIDATNAIVAAIQSPNDSIIIDFQTTDWIVAPVYFFGIQNKTIIFEPNVKLKAKVGAYLGLYDSLLEFASCQNITIIGYNAEFRMNKNEYIAQNDGSEYRHCLSLNNCVDITVKGLSFYDSGGDGIFVGGETTNNGLGYCKNIFIEDVKCINNFRQGMSIISAENMTVKSSRFSDTIGTLPEAGIDIEPYFTYHRIINLNIENCLFTNNGFSGIAVALVYMDTTSLPVSIIIKDCFFKNNCRPGNTYSKSEIYTNVNFLSPVQGNVLFERCFIEQSNYAAYYSRKTANAYLVTFKDCVFQDVSKLQIPYNEPIFLEVPDYEIASPNLGGYAFDDVLLTYNTNFNFLSVLGWSTLQGLANITGYITVVEPTNSAPVYTNVPQQTNVNFSYANQTSLSTALVSLNQIQNTAIECNATNATFEVARNSINTTYPLGISYSKSGSATFGDDVHLMTGGLIIPANVLDKTETIAARNDALTEVDETVLFGITSNPLYVQTLNIANFTIKDCTNLDFESNKLMAIEIYPNPANNQFNILIPNSENCELSIFDLHGRSIKSQFLENSNTEIDCSHFSNGVYILEITTEKGKYISKLVVKN